MSRVGKLPVPLPQGVTVNINNNAVTVKGPKG
jgi:large subunit ribosomal protein L6